MVVRETANAVENFEESLNLFKALQQTNFGQLPGQMLQIRDDQVRNSAGGYVFEVDDLSRVRRFLILGTTGGTYYVGEKELTIENVEHLAKMIAEGKGGLVLREIIAISLAGRNPKQDPVLMALAMCARYQVQNWKHMYDKHQEDGIHSLSIEQAKNVEIEKLRQKYMYGLHQAAFLAVEKVCRIPTHLFTFIKYCKMVSLTTTKAVKCEESCDHKGHTGWSRAMRKCISEWYLKKKPMELAMHITKYKNREGYSHRDLLRLAHPQASENHAFADKNECEKLTIVYDQIFHFVCNGSFDGEKAKPDAKETDEQPPMKKERCDYLATEEMVKVANESAAISFLKASKEIAKLTASDEEQCVKMISEFGLVREHIPTELLNSQNVWRALLEKMPMTALIRNLSKLSTVGLITGEKSELEKYVDHVVERVTDEEAIKKARIHPVSLLLASSVYTKGHGLRGSLTWTVNKRIDEALEKAFFLAFKNVEPTGKRFLLGLDVSGSMDEKISNGVLSCREAAVAISAVFLRTENEVEIMGFQNTFLPLPFTKKNSVKEMVDAVSCLSFGTTDCAQPMLWAAENQKCFDVFIVITDNETWCGNVHPHEAIRSYREKMSIPDAKVIVLAMTATKFTIADPDDCGMLDICGLDSAVPELIRSFVIGQL